MLKKIIFILSFFIIASSCQNNVKTTIPDKWNSDFEKDFLTSCQIQVKKTAYDLNSEKINKLCQCSLDKLKIANQDPSKIEDKDAEKFGSDCAKELK
ncbi:MAG: hypothetical protein U0457_14785 [Candidatus Sericytochromatia bacterium]